MFRGKWRIGSVNVRKEDVKSILKELNTAGARYLIVGGLAAILYDSREFTADLDLVVALDQENVLKVIVALEGLGYVPRVPVKAADFADPQKREQWMREKGMLVFSMINPRTRFTDVDLFVKMPFDFDMEFTEATWVEIDGIKAPLVSLDRLIKMKLEAGRPKDLGTVQKLKEAKKLRDG